MNWYERKEKYRLNENQSTAGWYCEIGMPPAAGCVVGAPTTAGGKPGTAAPNCSRWPAGGRNTRGRSVARGGGRTAVAVPNFLKLAPR